MLALEGGYHGDTLGAMGVCDPNNGMHTIFNRVLTQHFFAPRPTSRFGRSLRPDDLKPIENLLAQHHGEIAAVVLEPIVQGAGGMWFYSAGYLRGVRQLCDQYRVLLIADEIATGFGRTGKLFACEHADITPDILCLGKALTGGYMTLAATLATGKIAEGVSAQGQPFMHGPTFMGNPLACAVANKSIELLLNSNWQDTISSIEIWLSEFLEPYRQHPAVADVRICGAIGVVECREEIDVGRAQEKFVDAGVWIRPFGTLIYLMPPYIIAKADLEKLCQAIGLALGN